MRITATTAMTISKWQFAARQLSKVAAATDGVNNHRLAAGVFIKRDLVAVGWNRLKTDVFQMKYGKNADSIFIHAEIDAIKRAIRQLTNNHYLSYRFSPASTLVVIRYDAKSQRLKMAKPCAGCQRAISDFEIGRVLYSNDTGELEELA